MIRALTERWRSAVVIADAAGKGLKHRIKEPKEDANAQSFRHLHHARRAHGPGGRRRVIGRQPRAAATRATTTRGGQSRRPSAAAVQSADELGLAGKAENWILAGYEFNELKSGFIVIGKEVPRFKGLPVADLFDAAMKQIFPVMDFAIKAGDSRQFTESYAKITAACNACHTTADHSYIVIKVPEASNFPNQEFAPK
jgi:hypothetical protein